MVREERTGTEDRPERRTTAGNGNKRPEAAVESDLQTSGSFWQLTCPVRSYPCEYDRYIRTCLDLVSVRECSYLPRLRTCQLNLGPTVIQDTCRSGTPGKMCWCLYVHVTTGVFRCKHACVRLSASVCLSVCLVRGLRESGCWCSGINSSVVPGSVRGTVSLLASQSVFTTSVD